MAPTSYGLSGRFPPHELADLHFEEAGTEVGRQHLVDEPPHPLGVAHLFKGVRFRVYR